MKLKAQNIAYIVILIIAVYIWQVYNAAKKLSFAFGKITGLNLDNGTLQFTVYLNVTNGDMVGIPLTGINIDNVVGTSLIGKAILVDSAYIAGRQTSAVPIRIVIPFTDLLLLIPEIKKATSTKKISFALQGTVSAVGITVPLEQQYILDLNSIF